MRLLLLLMCLQISSSTVFSQKISNVSPNKKINIELYNRQKKEFDEWYLKIKYSVEGRTIEAIPQISLGILRSDQSFKSVKFIRSGKPLLINEDYTTIHGKRSRCYNLGNEITVSFENSSKEKMNLILRAYNDGVAFRYEFPKKSGFATIEDELTEYLIPDDTKRWLERNNPANEELYSEMANGDVQQNWGYPALFNASDADCWSLIHEANLDRNYCGTKLSNVTDKNSYKLTFPDQWNGRGLGDSKPTIAFPWKSPWRVVIIGSLADIVESTLVDDVATPCINRKTDWIKPGAVSWNYWSDNHGTRSYKTICAFADLAVEMNWPYTLLDWEWDSMGDGGKLEDALRYIHSKGIKPLIWYNSGGDHTWVASTPKDRMLTHENRVEEFTKLKKLGVAGVKIDFFESEKQNMIKYYLDILEDAAQFEIMVYFHGCLVPRGWARTYPHLMTYEGVRGAEWYNNGPEFTNTAPEHNTVLPFTRNVVGAMDYTPVTFTNSQFPHLTSYAHELALSILFESGLQHFADRPDGYYRLPDSAKTFLKGVPNAWDDIKLLDGYPGKEVTIARRKGNEWYIGGISADNLSEKTKKLTFEFLPEGVTYRLTLIADGNHDQEFSTRYLVVDRTSGVDVRMLRRGGFVAKLKPIS